MSNDLIARLRSRYSLSEGWQDDDAMEAADEIERLRKMVDELLDHCPVGECYECSQIVCPHGDMLHLHHDGCPSCWHAERAEARAALTKREKK